MLGVNDLSPKVIRSDLRKRSVVSRGISPPIEIREDKGSHFKLSCIILVHTFLMYFYQSGKNAPSRVDIWLLMNAKLGKDQSKGSGKPPVTYEWNSKIGWSEEGQTLVRGV